MADGPMGPLRFNCLIFVSIVCSSFLFFEVCLHCLVFVSIVWYSFPVFGAIGRFYGFIVRLLYAAGWLELSAGGWLMFSQL